VKEWKKEILGVELVRVKENKSGLKDMNASSGLVPPDEESVLLLDVCDEREKAYKTTYRIQMSNKP
jgi:hypothetical protein